MVSAGPDVRATADLRIGRIAAWTAMAASLLGVVLLVLVPQISRLIAFATWSDEQQEACRTSATPCEITVLASGATMPAWVGVVWPIVLIACLVASWSPRRWWIPQDASGASKQPGVYSLPEWMRAHAVAAAVINGALVTGLGRRTAVLQNADYAWGAAVGVVAIVLASICIAVTARSIPERTRALLAHTPGFWLLPVERRRRSGESRSQSRARGGRGAAPGERREARERRRSGVDD